MVRPNRRALTAMAHFDLMVENGLPAEGEAICAHVRHGDKIKEMKLHPLKEYIAQAEAMSDNPPGRDRHFFVITGDWEVIEALKLKKKGNWTFHWLNEKLDEKGYQSHA